jgi:hypothetical protein
MSTPVGAQSPGTDNTLKRDSATVSPPASIDDVAWLAGGWRGTGLGGEAAETWMEPSGGAMPGVFRVVRDGQVVFYEMMALVEHEGSLELRLKHFNADMTGWEDKEEMVTFRLIRVDPDAIYFGSLTFRRHGHDGLQTFVAVRQRDGRLEELAFEFTRVH